MALDEQGLYFVPLGGSEQFGVNLNVYACDGEYIAVDCGIGFADDYFPGIDILLPDPAFLEDQEDGRLQGLVITHAHEDHVGAVPHLWDRLGRPEIYTTRFTAAVLREKFKETKHKKVKIHVIQPYEDFELGNFNLRFIPVSHSIPDTASLLIETVHGRVLHSGDWNLDPAPVVGEATKAKDFQDIGASDILAYIGDSTNAEVEGRSGSEGDVEKGLEAEFAKCNGRIAVTIFSSNIGRIISIARAAQKCGRSVGVIGRSLHRMVGVARECGLMEGIEEFASEEELGYLPDDRTVIICTGSQGEARAALARIARGDHKSIKLNPGDTVIFSARAIPGNEKEINNVKNNLSAAGVRIITPRNTKNIIHVSGHPAREEITEMLGWVRPKAVIPVHGERVQLDAQGALARDCQIAHVVVPNNGSVIRLAPGDPAVVDHVETGVLAVDQKRLIADTHQSISGRRKLQYTGAVHVSVVLDQRGELLGEPKVDALGLIDEGEEEQIVNNMHDEILDLLDDMTWDERMDDRFVSEELRIGMRRFFYHILGIKPKATVHVIRI